MDNGISRQYVAIVNALADNWSCLSHAEYRAASWIINRTIRWNNGAELIMRRHVMKGVPNIDTGPLGMSYRHWLRCIRALETAGIIQTESTEYGLGVQVIYQRILKGPKQGRT